MPLKLLSITKRKFSQEIDSHPIKTFYRKEAHQDFSIDNSSFPGSIPLYTDLHEISNVLSERVEVDT